MPRLLVTASRAAVCLSLSSLMSRGVKVRPKALNFLMRSFSAPSATSEKPVAWRDAYMTSRAFASSSASKRGFGLTSSQTSESAPRPVTCPWSYPLPSLSRARASSQNFLVASILFLKCPSTRLYFSMTSLLPMTLSARSFISLEYLLEIARSSYRAWRSSPMSLAARRRSVITTSLVTAGETFGLPSRSPPIQLPNFTGTTVGGRGLPSLACTTESSCLQYAGNASQSTDSMMAMPPLASSCGVGFFLLISSLPQMDATVRRRTASFSERSKSPIDESSRLLRASDSFLNLRRMVRRLTSVGCAVKTISICCLHSWSKRASLSSDESILRVPSRQSSRCGPLVFVSALRSLNLWWFSATFTRFREWVKIRATLRHWASVREEAILTIEERSDWPCSGEEVVPREIPRERSSEYFSYV
mmetsp:Transcript_17927/g.36382  ORF Transcript_17927/g.36382 Transcript_17927/m.36382 type:complete len:418 (+) Transcript_17927:1525-2778(+)